jgi:hypothetical protein
VTDPHIAEAVLSVLAKVQAETEAAGDAQLEAIDPLGRADSLTVWR